MKYAFFYGIMILNVMISYSQNSARLSETKSEIGNTVRWDLDQYIWSHSHSQSGRNYKPVLDFDGIDKWIRFPVNDKVSLSQDGQYFVYGIQNNLNNQRDSVIIQSLNNNWHVVLSASAKNGFFSVDSKQYIFKDSKRLCLFQTVTKKLTCIKGVQSYKVNNDKVWLAYQLEDSDRTMGLLNLNTGKEIKINHVLSYNFDWTGEWLIYQLNDKNVVLQNLELGIQVVYDNVMSFNFDLSGRWLVVCENTSSKDFKFYNLKDKNELHFSSVENYKLSTSGDYLLVNTDKGLEYVNIKQGNKSNIWQASDTLEAISDLGFDGTGRKVFFLAGPGIKKNIWFWAEGMKRAEIIVNSKNFIQGKDLLIQDIPIFTDNGRYLKFTLGPYIPDTTKQSYDAVQVDVWDYKDKVLQSAQPYRTDDIKYTAVFDLIKSELILPERDFERLTSIKGDYGFIIKSGREVYGDRFWEKGYYEDSIWLFSFLKKQRKLLPVKKTGNVWVSPDGRYVIYFHAEKECNYYSYEMSSGKTVKISNGVPAWQLGIKQFNLRTNEKPIKGSGIKLWLDKGFAFLVYDKYGDIWQLDPMGNKDAICITNGFGRLNNIEFNLLLMTGPMNMDGKIGEGPFIGKDTLLLSAFNRKTKFHGFYRKVLGEKGSIEQLSMDPCYMNWLRNGIKGAYPIKASNADTWIVSRENATEAPNYFVTHDFKSFKQLTHLQPHKAYNWFTSELHSFKQLDGTTSQGVLYKPENFDSSRKYPLIISFYGDLSDQLYHYLPADYIQAPHIFSNPAWMVSHGYMVFTPDIYFIKDQYGPSTVNTIEGAARYLSQISYIDGNKMGVIGHSNSGRFGYYLFTHSSSFAAMSLGSGFGGTNILAVATSADFHKTIGESNLEWAENGAYGTGLGNIWKNKQSWIEHIAILQADKAKSPLLLFHNKKDGDDVMLAVQLFVSLRRLGKKAWWVQYDKGYHGVDGNDARDFTIRFTQFFDHYLKEAPPPLWMTQGIPYRLKGIESRYHLDTQGRCGYNCQVCKEKKWLHIINK